MPFMYAALVNASRGGMTSVTEFKLQTFAELRLYLSN